MACQEHDFAAIRQDYFWATTAPAGSQLEPGTKDIAFSGLIDYIPLLNSPGKADTTAKESVFVKVASLVGEVGVAVKGKQGIAKLCSRCAFVIQNVTVANQNARYIIQVVGLQYPSHDFQAN